MAVQHGNGSPPSTLPHRLNLLFLNIRSLRANKVLFQHLIAEERIAAFGLNETFLRPHHVFSLPPYTLQRCDRPATRGGGVALGFLRSIPIRQQYLPHRHLYPEHLVYTMFLPRFTITIATIYMQPRRLIPLDFLTYIDNTFRSYIIMADINFLSLSPRSRRAFTDHISQMRGLQVAITVPTLPLHNSNPDVIIASPNLIPRMSHSVLSSIGSNHLPILLHVTLHPPTIRAPISNPSKRINDYNHADWTEYRSTITDHLRDLHPPQTSDELERVTSRLQDVITEASKNCIPTRDINPHKPALPPHAITLIKASRRAYREFLRSRDPQALLVHRQLQRHARSYITAIKRKTWNDSCTVLERTKHPTAFWNKLKTLSGEKTATIYPIIHHDKALPDDESKAAVFADHLQDVFSTPFHTEFNHRHYTTVSQDAATSTSLLRPGFHHLQDMDPSEVPEPITPDDVTAVLRRKRNTAPGTDGITYRHLKQAPAILIQLLSVIYTLMLSTGLYPSTWKHSKILLFPKPGKPKSEVSSYRPISLIPVFSKVFETIIARRIHRHLSASNLLPPTQAGFRPLLSTNDLLLKLSTQLTAQFNSCFPSILILLDIEKAFDCVWHAGLIFKLRSYSFTAPYIRILASFLSGRTAQVHINTRTSRSFPISAGVPQGSVLSPLLYLLYTADMPQPQSPTHVFQFADDTAILSTSSTIATASRHIQDYITVLLTWFNQWRLLINPTKTQALILQHRRSFDNLRDFDVRIYGQRITHQPTVKYLGVLIDSKLQWTPHFTELRKKARRRLNLLKRMTGLTWGLRTATILKTYKTFLRPLLVYGSLAWLSADSNHYRSLQIIERHALRLAFGIKLPSPTQLLYEKLTFPEILHHLQTLRAAYFQRALDSDNPIVAATLQLPPVRSRLGKIKTIATPLALLQAIHLAAPLDDFPHLIFP